MENSNADMLAEGSKVERRPYKSRNYDTLIEN